jgi:alkaline phosphatase D
MPIPTRRSSRRHFLATATASLGALPFVRLTATAQPANSVFRHGVASGDPLADRVMLWTRVSSLRTDATDVAWTMATDAAFKRVVARGEGRTGAWRDFTVKVDVTGLDPGTTYYYRFDAEKSRSPIGRTRTLPRGSSARLRVAVVSCSNYPFGYFNAYGAIAARADLDVVVHLGDYIYEYANAGFGDGAALKRIPEPNREIVALADYRQRHAQYKADPDSQEVHRQHPFVVVWDDHEFANNTWSGGAQNHNPEKAEGDWYARRNAAAQAFFEWMPIREDAQALSPRIYRTLRFANLADLILLDTRLVGRDEQVARDNIAAVESPTRSLLGRAQEEWLFGELRESRRAGTRWQLLGQQVMFAPQTDPGQPASNPDSWDGYRMSRDRVFDMVEQLKIDSFAVLTGDVHSSWVYDLPRRLANYDRGSGKGSLGVEIAGTSVTSRSNLGVGPDREKQLANVRATRPHLHYADGAYRGYYLLDITPERLQADFFAVKTIESRTRDERFEKGFVTPAGHMYFTEAASPAPPGRSTEPAL